MLVLGDKWPENKNVRETEWVRSWAQPVIILWSFVFSGKNFMFVKC